MNIKIINKITLREDPKETIINSQSNTLNSSTNSKIIRKSEDLFNIGFILIYCALGGQNIINFSNFECIHGGQCCCLYHCIEKYEINLKTKLKITNFINKNLFSEDFISFLCLSTSYNQNMNNLTMSKLKRHPFVNVNEDIDKYNKNSNFCDVDLIDLLKVTLESAISFNKKRDMFDKKNIKRFNSFCDSLLMLIQSSNDRTNNLEGYRIGNGNEMFIELKNKLNSKNKDDKDIIEISKEFGLEVDYVIEKLSQIFSVSGVSNGRKSS